jgi:HD-GYP domain-containing protein (c-di-GMP phosphodiesterase class II)
MSDGPNLRRPRLLWTLLGVMIVVGVLPLVVSHYVLIGINRESLETLEKKYLTRSAVGISGEVQDLVASYTQQLKKIAAGMQISSSLSSAQTAFLDASGTGLIELYTTADQDLLGLRIVNRAGQGAKVEPAGLGPDIEREMRQGLSLAFSGEDYVGTFQYLEVANQPAIVLAVPVKTSSEIIGAVEALVSLRRISERVDEEGRAEVTAFIVDRTGRALMHSTPSVNVERPDLSDVPIVEEFKKAPVRLTQSYERTINGEKVKMLGTVAPVPATDWGVIVEKDQARAFASVKKMITGTIQWAAVAVGLAVILGSFFATGISRPIHALAESTREIAGGNYDMRVEVKSRNEIGDLAHNFNLMADEIQKAFEQLKKAAEENNLLFINSVRMLAAAIDAKDPYTRGHSERVARYSIAIGKHLRMTAADMRNLRISALLHDVGKIGIDDRILRKPGALSDEEFEIMKTHPAKGAAIMSGVAQLIDIIPGMKYHHERWNGGGYPDNLKGEEIPMQARIVAVADTFDAMTTNRPYQKAMDIAYVVQKIRELAGNRYDPVVVEAFAAAVKHGDVVLDEQIRGAA